jgi:hypothetical protein
MRKIYNFINGVEILHLVGNVHRVVIRRLSGFMEIVEICS